MYVGASSAARDVSFYYVLLRYERKSVNYCRERSFIYIGPEGIQPLALYSLVFIYGHFHVPLTSPSRRRQRGPLKHCYSTTT